MTSTLPFFFVVRVSTQRNGGRFRSSTMASGSSGTSGSTIAKGTATSPSTIRCVSACESTTYAGCGAGRGSATEARELSSLKCPVTVAAYASKLVTP